ncbi:MAG: hypothetical protein U0176_18690 [Bacteroidia bacterium]
MAPMLLQAQSGAWTETITLPDRREAGAMDVAKITFQGFSLTEPTSPGQPIASVNGKPEQIRFPGLEAGYIKFRISQIEWLTDAKVGYDGSPDYKVIVRNQWVEMSPKIYLDGKKGNAANLRKRYITAQNFEYVKGDSLPPPAIFKIDKNGSYTFTIGVKALTPKTTEERPFDFNFSFGVAGLQASIEEAPDPDKEQRYQDSLRRAREDSLRRVREAEEALKNQNTDDIDAAVKQAIENEDAESLMDLIKDHPDVQSVKDARQYLTLKMTKELVDSVTYRVDFKFAKWTRAVPSKEDMEIAFSRYGVGLPESALSPRWDEGKVFLRPPRDSVDYIVTAEHRSTRGIKASITLNSVKDNIRFSYRDTMEGARVAIKVKGGNGPYTLFLQRYAEGVFFDIEGSMVIAGDTIVDKDKLGRIYKLGEEGDFRMFIVDSQQLKKTGSGLVHLVPPPPIPPVVWYAGLAALGVFLIVFLLYRREKRRKDEELERLLDTRGGSEPKVKRKPKPELAGFWKETAISDLSLHKNFIREISTYLKERPHSKSEKPRIEGVILGTVLKFDFENEQYEVRLDRFRAIDARSLDHYEESSTAEQWPEIREVANDHRDLVKIGWLQVVEGRPMELGDLEQQFQDEQFSELFQLLLKIDIVEGKRLCGFFTRTTSGKINNKNDRQEGVTDWMNWDELEDAGYYEFAPKPVREGEGDGKIKVRLKNQETA